MKLVMLNDRIVPLDELDPIYFDRGIYFGDGVYEVLRSYHGKLFALSDHLERFAQPGPSGLLFPADHGGHLSQSTLNGKPGRRRIIKGRIINESSSGFCRAREAAGRPDLRLHDLRHTGAVLAAQTGATLAELMARLGHSTPAAAMRYQHAARDRDKAIAAALSELAGGA